MGLQEEKGLTAAIVDDQVPHGPFPSQNFPRLQNVSVVLKVRLVVVTTRGKGNDWQEHEGATRV